MASAGTPLALILSMTAVIASVFARWASCAVRARLSAAIETHARSGACFTTPSPMVTMTGGPGGGACWANTGDASARRRVAISGFIPLPHMVFRLKAEARQSCFCSFRLQAEGAPRQLRRARDAEANSIRIRVRRDFMAMTARQHANVRDQPAAAAHDAHLPEWRAGRVTHRGRLVVTRVVPV